jgi:CDP-4-dehydro-6-deoxyglucose reductase
MIPPWQQGVVIKIEPARPNTLRYWIQIQGTTVFDFKPGQFVTLDLPIHEKKNKRWRSYSIASMPDGNVIELVVVRMEGGLGSTYLFNEVKVGSSLTLRGPQGVFTLDKVDLTQDVLMICTGTGIAPFRSMLQYIKAHSVPHKRIDLVFGTRTSADLLYDDEMKELEHLLPTFTYYPTLSREDWDGYKGYVHEVYEKICADRHPAQFMLCGWRGMIDEAKKRIQAMGYDYKSIHEELYG